MILTATPISDLLDDTRIQDLKVHVTESYLEPRRFVAWTEQKRLLVVIDLDMGEILKCRVGFVETREEAEAAIAELVGQVH